MAVVCKFSGRNFNGPTEWHGRAEDRQHVVALGDDDDDVGCTRARAHAVVFILIACACVRCGHTGETTVRKNIYAYSTRFHYLNGRSGPYQLARLRLFVCVIFLSYSVKRWYFPRLTMYLRIIFNVSFFKFKFDYIYILLYYYLLYPYAIIIPFKRGFSLWNQGRKHCRYDYYNIWRAPLYLITLRLTSTILYYFIIFISMAYITRNKQTYTRTQRQCKDRI